MTASFRQRCASALTHPLTIAAVVVLLANDLAFKLLWPDHWVTGKLSDLAWVVFAPPLLALLLSFLTFRKPSAERAAFAAAYAVLPLTYVAFNSSEAMHGWVLSVLLPLTGSIVGSPFDPTDSLVVLPGLALAVWVWRQAPARPESTRMRLYLFAAVAMALATVATSVEEPSRTEWLVGISDKGTVAMEGPNYEHYESGDGGITWTRLSERQPLNVEWGTQEAATPRGTYSIRGFEIVLSRSGAQPTVVYSAAYLNEEANQWAQKYASRRLRVDISKLYDNPEAIIGQNPFNIAHDTRTGNVIVGMGLDGVLVGYPDGRWERAGVGEFVPMDFSFQAKARLMLSSSFWYVTLAVSLLFVTAASICSGFNASSKASEARQQGEPPSRRIKRWRWISGLSLPAAVILVLLLAVFAPPFSDLVSYLALLLVVSIPLLLGGFALAWSRRSFGRVSIAVFSGVLGSLIALRDFPPYAGDVGTVLYIDTSSTTATIGLTFAILAAIIYFPRKYEAAAYAIALVCMVALTPLPFLLWLADRLTLAVASLGAVVLLLLISGALFGYLVRRRRAVE